MFLVSEPDPFPLQFHFLRGTEEKEVSKKNKSFLSNMLLRDILPYLKTRYSETAHSIYLQESLSCNTEEFQQARCEAYFLLSDKQLHDFQQKIREAIQVVFCEHLIDMPIVYWKQNSAIFEVVIFTDLYTKGFTVGFTTSGLSESNFMVLFILRLMTIFKNLIKLLTIEIVAFFFSQISIFHIPPSIVLALFEELLCHKKEKPDSGRLQAFLGNQKILMMNDDRAETCRLFISIQLPKLKAFQYQQCEKHMTYFEMMGKMERFMPLMEREKKRFLLIKPYETELFHPDIPFSREEQFGYYLGHKKPYFRDLISRLFANEVCPLIDALGDSFPPEVNERIGFFIATLMCI